MFYAFAYEPLPMSCVLEVQDEAVLALLRPVTIRCCFGFLLFSIDSCTIIERELYLCLSC